MLKDDLTYKIIGCAMKIHHTLGPGFQEVIYQRCLSIELEQAKLEFAREQEHTVFMRILRLVLEERILWLKNKVIVEIKALVRLEDTHLAQAKNYTVVYDFPKGLLINFGAPSFGIQIGIQSKV